MSENLNNLTINELKESVKRGNLQPDNRDERDYNFSDTLMKLDPVKETLPGSKDLRNLNLQIENQGHLGSCVAQSCVNNFEILLTKSSNFYNLSRLFNYFIAREPYEGLCCKDTGAHLRDGIKETAKKGIPKESTWDYIEANVNTRPSEIAYQEALGTKVDRYERIYGFGASGDKDITAIKEIKVSLLRGFPVSFSMLLTNDFFSMGDNLNTQNYRGTFDESSIGGHAMCIVGYNDSLGGFIVENSWGSNWGDSGYFLLKYDVAFKDGWDAWVVTGFNGILFEDEYHHDRPFSDTGSATYTIYKGDLAADHYGSMTCGVKGKFPPLTYHWFLESTMLTSTLLRDRTLKTAKIKLNRVPLTLDGHVIVTDSRGNFVVQPYLASMLEGTQDKVKEFIQRLYYIILDRTGEAGGVNYWSTQLKNHTLTGEGIVNSFFEQPEWINKHYDNGEIIKRVYRTMLGREPDAGGYAFWTDALNRTQDLRAITRGFASSAEFQAICQDYGIVPYV